MHGESLVGNFRAKAAEIGMEGADAKITKAWSSPQTSKYLQGIYQARQLVKSKANDVKKIQDKVFEMRVKEYALHMETLELRAYERDLEDQVHTSCSHI